MKEDGFIGISPKFKLAGQGDFGVVWLGCDSIVTLILIVATSQ